MTTRLSWFAASADQLRRLSAKRCLIWVVSDRPGQSLAREGHVAEWPALMHVNEVLADYLAGPGVGRDGAQVRWQLWNRGQMAASG